MALSAIWFAGIVLITFVSLQVSGEELFDFAKTSEGRSASLIGAIGGSLCIYIGWSLIMILLGVPVFLMAWSADNVKNPPRR